jgi:hypothetical protein
MSGGTREVETASAPGGGGTRGRLAWVVGPLLAVALLMFCYLRVAGATQVNSDGAGLVLEASSVLHGNVLLHGWWATDVSFYTTELPEYVAVTGVAGIRPEVVHICSALTYTLLVLLAAFVARGRARGTEGVVRALLAAGIMLAPQPTGPTQVLLGSPDHVGTAVPVLLLLLLLDWAAPRWYVPVGAGLLLAAATVGDPLIEVVGVAPLFLGCLIRAGRILWQRRADPPPPGGRAAARLVAWAWPAAWYEVSLAIAAAVSVPVARLAYRLIEHLGGYRTAKAFYGLQSLHEIVHGLPLAVRGVLALFGADYLGVTGAGNVAFALVHLIGVAVALAAVVLAARRLVWPGARLAPWQFRRDARAGGGTLGDSAGAAQAGDLIADLLVLAIAANFAAFLIDVPMENIYSSHEIGPVLGLGAALAGRVIGPLVAARRGSAAAAAGGSAGVAAPAAADGTPRSGPRRLLLGAFAAGLACYALMLGIAAAHKQAPPRNVGLTGWLVSHHLTSGLAPYWEATSVTVDSGGTVSVLAIQPEPGGNRLEPQHWQSEVQLATTAGRSADFVILSPAENVRRREVTATFGKSAGTYRYGPFTIMVWHKNLLPHLVTAPAPARHHVTAAWGLAGRDGRRQPPA